MAKTADVIQAIWGDPWFLALSVDAKCLYFWGITNEHGNLAGVYTVAAPMIQLETGLTPTRFAKALEELDGKFYYRAETGAVWVRGRAKRVRSKTSQIAKSIAKAVEECPEADFIAAFLHKYGQESWLSEAFSDLALSVDKFEPHPNLNEVPSQSHSQSHSQSSFKEGGSGGKPNPDSLPEDFDPKLHPVLQAVQPILHRVAVAKGARPVERLPLAKTLTSYPDRDHVAVANDLEHWSLFGNGEKRRAKDIVASYRNFLKRADAVAQPRPGLPAGKSSKYEGVAEVSKV